MRNAHDVGGQLGYGPVPRGDDLPFHAEWERLAFGITLGAIANGFLHNVDENRYAKERMRPQDLANCTYYELWLASLEMNLVENGVLTLAEIAEAETHYQDPGVRGPSAEEPASLTAAIDGMLANGGNLASTIPRLRRYEIGDAVVVTPTNDRRHSRVPAYAAGRPGVIVRTMDCFPVPGVVAHGLGDDVDWCYTVRFEADVLWGQREGADREAVYLDVWENDLSDGSSQDRTSSKASDQKEAYSDRRLQV